MMKDTATVRAAAGQVKTAERDEKAAASLIFQQELKPLDKAHAEVHALRLN